MIMRERLDPHDHAGSAAHERAEVQIESGGERPRGGLDGGHERAGSEQLPRGLDVVLQVAVASERRHPRAKAGVDRLRSLSRAQFTAELARLRGAEPLE